MNHKKKSGRKPTGRVRLEDIAKKCNLSISTVSRVINNRTDQFPIAQDTIQRIHEAAKELGYRPNRLARAIAYQKTNLIGLSVPHYKTSPDFSFGEEAYFTAKVFGLLSAGVLDNPKMLNYDLIIHDRRKFTDNGWDYNHFQDDLMDGMIYCNPTADSIPFLQEILKSIPVIILGYIPQISSQFISVDIDNHAAAKSCIKHIVKSGRKNPLILIPEKLKKFLCISDRLNGYIEALKEYNLPATEHNILTVEQNPESVYALLSSLKTLREHDAIIAPSDELISYCINPLINAGFKLPEDIALIGFDDSDRCLSSTPRLTSVKTPFHAMAFKAVDLLIDILNEKQTYTPSHHTIETDLCIRESTQKN